MKLLRKLFKYTICGLLALSAVTCVGAAIQYDNPAEDKSEPLTRTNAVQIMEPTSHEDKVMAKMMPPDKSNLKNPYSQFGNYITHCPTVIRMGEEVAMMYATNDIKGLNNWVNMGIDHVERSINMYVVTEAQRFKLDVQTLTAGQRQKHKRYYLSTLNRTCETGKYR